MAKTIKILVLGDIVGQPGCRALFVGLSALIKKTRADFVVANGENAFEGLGITPEIADKVFQTGVDVITSGNHIWQRREILPLLDTHERLLRPENYPIGVPGKGHCLISKKDISVAVVNLQGRLNLSYVRCPFAVGRDLVRRLRQKTNFIVIDFHAEVPEEKEALALFLDGSISALVGTHTHVATADEKILSGGTGYITDIGMTGPQNSVIGMKPEISVKRSLTQMPHKMEVQEGTPTIMGVLLDLDRENGRTVGIRRIKEAFPSLS